jgi:DnaK suppressor protein
MIDTATVKAQLEERLAELRARQDSIACDLAEPLNADSSEQAIEIEDDAALGGQASLIEREVASVSRALERVAKGTYGECVRCGGAIAAPRLEARPEAALCIRCASSEQ